MAAPVLLYMTLAERIVALVKSVFSRKPKDPPGPSSTASGPGAEARPPLRPRPPYYRPRPKAILGVSAAWLAICFLVGCASTGAFNASTLQDLAALCEQVVPCEPCATAPPNPAPSPVDPGGGSSPPVSEPDNPGLPPDAGGGAGPLWGPDNPNPNDEDRGGYDHSSLWKPVSESTGNLIVIVGYGMDFETVTVAGQTAKNKGNGNGHRGHFPFSKPGARYGKNVGLLGVDAQGGRWRAVVINGAKRSNITWKKFK